MELMEGGEADAQRRVMSEAGWPRLDDRGLMANDRRWMPDGLAFNNGQNTGRGWQAEEK